MYIRFISVSDISYSITHDHHLLTHIELLVPDAFLQGIGPQLVRFLVRRHQLDHVQGGKLRKHL